MRQLCEAIGMPAEVTRQILALEDRPCPDISGLTCPETWDSALRQVSEALGDDPLGIGMLRCMLRCALDARAEYDRLSLPEKVYFDTMACFSRFVREHKESYGVYGFDRAFWTVRQVSCKLFRIGQLEYELVDGAVSLHIPTDVRLEQDLLRQSWTQAKAILDRTFPEYKTAPYICRSWLLSTSLAHLLPETSRILTFQRSFAITPLDAPCRGVIQWVFKNPKLQPEDYPEGTSLQRKLKAYLLAGNCFQDARGVLSPDPFRE